jgi:hypothetical protein
MAQQQISSQQSSTTDQEDEIQRRQLRLFFFIFLTIWTLAAIGAVAVAFCITKNSLSFSLFTTIAPSIYLWYRFAKHLFPMDEKTFELKKLQIQMKAQNNNKSN